jgi:hypothetical protein
MSQSPSTTPFFVVVHTDICQLPTIVELAPSMSYSTRTRRSAASSAEAAIRRSIPEPSASSTPRRRALAKSVSYAEVPIGTDDPEPSEHSSDGEGQDTDPMNLQPADAEADDEDAEGEDDIVMEDGNGKCRSILKTRASTEVDGKYQTTKSKKTMMMRNLSKWGRREDKRLGLSALEGVEVDQEDEVVVGRLRDQLDRAERIQRTRIQHKRMESIGRWQGSGDVSFEIGRWEI